MKSYTSIKQDAMDVGMNMGNRRKRQRLSNGQKRDS